MPTSQKEFEGDNHNT